MGKVSVTASVALLVAVMGFAGAVAIPMWMAPTWEPDGIEVPDNLPDQIRIFSSYEEMESFILSRVKSAPYFGIPEARDAILAAVPAAPSFSETNVQVEGVDEADIVKTDGAYIYLVSDNLIYILRAYPTEEATVLYKIELEKGVRGIFVIGDRLVVFVDEYTEEGQETVVKVYDVRDRSAPVLEGEFSVSGMYFTSRAIGDFVYLISTSPAVRAMAIEPDRLDVAVPVIEVSNSMKALDPSQIYYFPQSNETYYGFTTIVAFNVKAELEEPIVSSFLLGPTNNLYMSLSNLYVAAPNWETVGESREVAIRAPVGIAVSPISQWYENTVVHRFSIKELDIKYETSGEVSGRVLNQFSMDEYNGYFRVATTRWEEKPVNDVHILNMSMDIVGAVTGLASGEWIHSARFVSDKSYLVTFKKTDPLFVIDLSDPTKPEVLGWLKIPGYSNYLHPYDETSVIGVGKETVEAEQGDFAWYQGVKVSLFDVSDVENPKELAKYIIGDRGSETPVLHDHKAFLFDKERDLLVIPVLVAVKENPIAPPWEHGKFVWQGAYIFEVSPEGGIVLRGWVTHLPENALGDQKGLYEAHRYFVERVLYIGDVLYTISDGMVKMNSLTDLAEIGSLELA